MPKATCNLNGQAVAQLAGEHDDLPAMMAFMSDEIGQNMGNIERKIAPGVRSGDWNRAASLKTKRQQADNAAATAVECLNQLLPTNLEAIDCSRHRDAVFLS